MNCITTFFNHLHSMNVGGWREISRCYNHRNKASPWGCDYRQRDMQKRKPDSYNWGFCIIQFYKLRLHTPNPVNPFQETQRDEWSYQLSREGGRNITAGILKSDLTVKLLLPATLSDKWLHCSWCWQAVLSVTSWCWQWLRLYTS